MPVDLEMLLSTSPSLFTHSTISDCRFNNYAVQSRNILNCHRAEVDHRPLVFQHGSFIGFPNHSQPLTQNNNRNKHDTPENVTDTNSKSEKKKRVSFADDKGLSLVDIREITEDFENSLPWTDDFLSMLTCGVNPNVTSEKKWKPTFDHPPYDPIILSSRVEKDMVALENAILEEANDDLLTGTIKVRNIAFEKEVFVRATFDRWISFKDIPASFVDESDKSTNGLEAAGGIDTFKFSLEIPQSASRYQVVEFCAGYRCSGKEYWDNNGGINYRLVTSSTVHRYCGNSQNLTKGRRHSNVESPTWGRMGFRW